MNKNKAEYFPNNPDFDYLKFPFYWIAQVESLYTQEMEKTLKTMGMDSSRWRVGLLLHVHDELTISQISNNALMKLSTITKIIQRMQKEGLVTVYKHNSDGRVKLVKLTEQGTSYVDLVIKNTTPMFAHVYSNFSKKEIETFVQLSKRLFDNLANNVGSDLESDSK